MVDYVKVACLHSFVRHATAITLLKLRTLWHYGPRGDANFIIRVFKASFVVPHP